MPALGVGTGTAYVLYRDLQHAFEAHLADSAGAVALAVERHIETRRAVLTTLGNAFASEPLTREALARLYQVARRTADDIGDPVILFLPDGVAFRTNEPFGGALAPVLDVDGVRRAFETKAPVISNLFVKPRVIVPILVPVVRDGVAVAVVGSRIGQRTISDLITAAQPTDTAFISVVDAQHRVVASAPEANASTVGQQVTDWQQQAIAANPGGGLVQGTSLRGIPVIAAVKPIPTAPGWTVILAAPLNTYEAMGRRPLFWMVLGGLAAFLLSYVTAVWLARRLIRPFVALTRHAKELAAGGLQAGLPLEPDVPIPVEEIEMVWLAIARANIMLLRHLKEAEASEARFRAVIDSAIDAIIVMDEQGVVRHFSGAAEGIFGWTVKEIVGQKINMLMPEPHAAQHDSYLSRYFGTGERHFIGMVGQVNGRRKDGSVVPLETTVGEWRDAEERRFFVGILRDITDRKRAEERQIVLTREVDHRAKNLLAVVQAVVRMSKAESTKEFVASVSARVNALARAHSLLAEQGWEGADLMVLAEQELEAYANRATLHGPPVSLVPTAVQPISMILHELSTNAAKHGALSSAGGQVDLSWSVDTEEDMLRLRWHETGGPPVAQPPTHRSFGSRLVDSTATQMGGAAQRQWLPSGLLWEMQVPVQRVLQTSAWDHTT